MDEPTGGEIRRGDSYRVGTGDIDASTLELAEELGRRFKVDHDRATVELNFHNGRFGFAWLKRRVQIGQLPEAHEPRRPAS